GGGGAGDAEGPRRARRGAPGQLGAARHRPRLVNYVSTRGVAPSLPFGDVLLEGLATDGGLYVPESWPTLPALDADASYADVAAALMWPFVEGSMGRDDYSAAVADAYATFPPPEGASPDVVPVSDLGVGLWLA